MERKKERRGDKRKDYHPHWYDNFAALGHVYFIP